MLREAFVVFSLLASPLSPGMTWQELDTEIASVEGGNSGNPQIILRFSEMVHMLMAYNKAVQETYPQSQLFCPPRGMPLHIDEIVSMVRSEARQGKVEQDTLVQSLMLAGFRRRFPC